jgi:hypothetical protein
MASTVEAAQFLALELSYANDPIAVSYLDRLLSAHTLAYEKAVQGLERIGTDEAVEVLLSALNENSGDIAELATRSLGRMQGRIANPVLRETVKKAVGRSFERARNEFIKTQVAYLDYRSPELQRAAKTSSKLRMAYSRPNPFCGDWPMTRTKAPRRVPRGWRICYFAQPRGM